MIHNVEQEDRNMGKSMRTDLKLHQDVGDSLFRLWAMDGKFKVGKLTAVIREENTVLLSDVIVDEAVVTCPFPFRRILCKWWPRIGTTNYRQRGVGTKMLESFLGWCRENQISQVYGSVVQRDLDTTPMLLKWYGRHGFDIRQPDSRCIGNAVHLVVWENDGSAFLA